MNAECKNCKFFIGREDPENPNGECHRFPPRADKVNYPNKGIIYGYQFPTLPEYEWCGEFKKRGMLDG